MEEGEKRTEQASERETQRKGESTGGIVCEEKYWADRDGTVGISTLHLYKELNSSKPSIYFVHGLFLDYPNTFLISKVST